MFEAEGKAGLQTAHGQRPAVDNFWLITPALKCTQGSAVKCSFRHGYQDFGIDHGADSTDIKLDDDETFQPATGCSIGILRLKQA